jgi:ribonuclease BN (tRNA processing enzyme)
MTTSGTHSRISKCIRQMVIALGLTVAMDAGAADAPPLGGIPAPGNVLASSALLTAGGPVAATDPPAAAAVQSTRAGARIGCGPSGVALQVLGSGGPELQDKRASTSYLIWRGGLPRVLVDSGGGSALRFGESGATMSDLDVILLTHLHVDHTADLTALVKSSFFEERHRSLPVYGPDGNKIFPSTTRFIKTLFAAPNGAYQYLSDFVTPGAADSYLLEAHNVVPAEHEVRQIYDARGTRIFATRVVHGGVPAIAYRVELDNVSIAFSGDTDGNNGNLERLAHNANLFVAHNAVPEGATGVERSLHMPPSVIGKIASTAAVKQLVLAHRMLRTLGRESESLAAIRSTYSGAVAFADDLQCFQVSP